MGASRDGLLWAEFYRGAAEVRACANRGTKVACLARLIRSARMRTRWEQALHPLRVHNMTAVQLEKLGNKPRPKDYDLPQYRSFWGWLEAASQRTHTPIVLAHAWASQFGGQSWEAIEGMRMVLDKDPRCGVSLSTYNEAARSNGQEELPNFTNLIARGYPYTGSDLHDGTWYWSRKLDGVRCVILCEPRSGEISFVSRQGRAIPGLERLREETLKACPAKWLKQGFALDGELVLRKPDGKDDFKGIQSALNRKDTPVERVAFYAFDTLSPEAFRGRHSDVLFYDRQMALLEFERVYRKQGGVRLSVVEQVLMESREDVENHIAYAFNQGWEGSIFRRNAPYIGKKSRDILKSKGQADIELRVTGITATTKAMLRDGKWKDVRCMGAARVAYSRDGVEGSLKVGSGWSDEDRILFLQHPKKLIGKLITVQYTEETCDENGIPSVRNPRVKAIHGVRREL